MKEKSSSTCCNFFNFIINLIIQILSLFLHGDTIKYIKEVIECLPADLRYVFKYIKMIGISIYYQITNATVIDIFDQNVHLSPNKPCLIFEGLEWSFKEVEQYSRRVAQAFKNDLRKGDVVGLLMSPNVQYAPIWIGLGRLGIISALFNTSQRNQPLIHSIKLVKPKVIIFTPDLAQALSEIATEIDPEIKMYCFGTTTSMINYTNLQEVLTNSNPDYSVSPKLNYKDVLMYIFTSGSTGLPKAAIMPHYRYLMFARMAGDMVGVKIHDRVYCALPLYHAAGGIIGTSTALILGATIVIRGKFSASAYFKDCIKYHCSVAMYIGEVVRYLTLTPPSVEDKLHSVRLLMGNGLQKEVWKQLHSRFNISDVAEYYGSTEGTVTIINYDNVVGSCGFLPRHIPFLKSLLGVYVIKVDEEGTPMRDENGLCIECKANEPGMPVGIINAKRLIRQFLGYINQEEDTKKKLVYDVMKKGDKAFTTGDILIQDNTGYFYFKDRIGDTFRWKGENVATTEVEYVLRGFPKIHYCTVYGVQIPGTEGRAGMAAIIGTKSDIDFTKLVEYLDDALPKYAQPLFVRLVAEFECTQTFKVKKTNFQKEGFNIHLIEDPIYFKRGNTYEELNPITYNDIMKSRVHL